MKRLALFAHYDPRAQVKRYVVHHLQALREVCDETWFVSTASLPEQELAKVRPICERAWTRENVGYDFGSWSDALDRVTLTDWDELVLTNSSVFGPLWPLREAFERMSTKGVDFWGMTDSGSVAWHIQSYFLVFRARLLHSTAFRELFRGVTGTDKLALIRKYEVGLTTAFTRAGFRAAVLVPGREIPRPFLQRMLRPNFNPPISQPMALLERRMPYVKIELLRNNPRRRPLEPVRAAMRAAGYDSSLIEIDPRPPEPWR